ncbi:peptide ABC transporter substrate-binding protein [Ruminococcaceae bacterium OttesenSCG-928-L11]|nr:peptide ABC transporter substrate-binding protein [Ruminococcaceae bacterium OttesenSCG-928-L11]
MKRLLLFLAVLCIAITGCSSDNTGKVFRYDIASTVSNLDPQYAVDSTARLIIANIFEGLVVQEPDGTIAPGVAERWEVSSDGTVYTFYLRDDTGWHGKESVPVTAHDFVFTFRRIFSTDSPSPYASDFLLIKNGAAVKSGSVGYGHLGVKALNDFTLEITLEHASPLFLELMATTAAMPCNEKAFQEARGRYGLEKKLVGANGPFYVDGWTDKQISLRVNSHYRSDRETLSGGVNLYIGREDSAGRVLSETTDVAKIPIASKTKALSDGLHVQTFEKTTWCIVFNLRDATWSNPLIRQGLAYALEYRFFTGMLTENFTATSVLVPPATLLGDHFYREQADKSTPLAYDTQKARTLFNMGLEALGLEHLPTTQFYVPDTGNHPLQMGLVQQGWQKNLAAYINIAPVSAQEIEERLVSGRFQVMLAPFSPSSPRVESLLSDFTGTSSRNWTGYENPRYDHLLDTAVNETSMDRAAIRFGQAERMLLADAVVIPVYFETTYYATGKEVEGIEIYPFGDRIYFKYGLK